MIQISSIEGNVFRDKKSANVQDSDFEKVRLSRMDLEKTRLRCTTDRGTDIGFVFDYGTHLHDGDIMIKDGRRIIVEQMPEKVLVIKPRKEVGFETLVLLGHIIGNRHRPISVQPGEISFPIQADTEKETFQRLFDKILTQMEIGVEDRVFKPHEGADVHEH